MRFALELVDVKCNAVLSTDHSDWGASDGIRIYFVAFTNSGYEAHLVSGREYPPPDAVDNLSFVPGKRFDLAKFPPLGGGTWQIPIVDVSEFDNLWVAVIGVNEGLPYIAGGGGGGSSTVFRDAVEEFIKTLAGGAVSGTKGAEPPTAAAVSGIFGGLNAAIDSLNQSDNCRGAAFAYEIGFSAHYLFSQMVGTTVMPLTLDKNGPIHPLEILNRARQGGDCGYADYELHLRIHRIDQLRVDQSHSYSFPGFGVPRTFEPALKFCAPKDKEILVWPVIRDETTTLQPNFTWPTMIWKVEGQAILSAAGTLTTNVWATLPPLSGVQRAVDVGYEVSDVGGVDRLVLRTDGDDGNFELRVELWLKFFDQTPPVLFSTSYVDVTGQLLAGNDAYYDYLNCVDRFMKLLSDIQRRYVRVKTRLGPGEPVEDLGLIERKVAEVVERIREIAIDSHSVEEE